MDSMNKKINTNGGIHYAVCDKDHLLNQLYDISTMGHNSQVQGVLHEVYTVELCNGVGPYS